MMGYAKENALIRKEKEQHAINKLFEYVCDDERKYNISKDGKLIVHWYDETKDGFCFSKFGDKDFRHKVKSFFKLKGIYVEIVEDISNRYMLIVDFSK